MRLLFFSVAILFSGSSAFGQLGTVEVWLTRGDQSSLLDQQSSLQFSSGNGTNSNKIEVNPQSTYQTMEGFGAAMTDSSAWLLYNSMSSAQRNALLTDLFDRDSGIGLSYLRIPMGASDFALSPYTYNDIPTGQTDPNLTQFSIAHDEAYIIPSLQQALAINPELRFMATPWSPPAWMKSSQTLFGGSLLSQNYPAYAQYFVKFIEAYEAHGLPMDTLTVQNEPLNNSTGLPSMLMSTFQQSTFIGDHLGPALAAANIDTKILAYDHNWDQWNYPVVVMNDPEANFYVAGSAFHAYAGDVANQSLVNNLFPNKGLYFTEITGGEWSTNFSNNLDWAFENIIIGATRNWAKTVLYWNLALDQNNGPFIPGGCEQCRGIVTILGNGSFTREVEYYALAHVSKFVRPGAVRIDANTSTNGIDVVAFLNPDDSEVLVFYNRNNGSRSIDVVRGSEHVSYAIPGHAAITMVWSQSTAEPIQEPFSGTPTAIPGRVELEFYDVGGQGVAYNDCDSSNNGGAFRSNEGVDIETSSESGFNVGWLCPEEWIEYTIEVAATGTYNLSARVASPQDGGAFQLLVDDVSVLSNVAVPNTGGWQDWSTINSTVDLVAGEAVLRFQNSASASEYNISWIEFAPTCLPGDLNFDGNVDGADIDPFVAELVGDPSSNPFVTCAADVNQDGAVDLAIDVNAFIDCLLSAAPCP